MELEIKKEKPPKKRLITCRFAVEDLDAEARKIIVEAQRFEQEAVNRILLRWASDSFNAEKDGNLRIFLGLYQRWKDAGQTGEKPKLEIKAVESDFSAKIAAELREALPCYHSRCLTLTVQRVVRTIIFAASHTGHLKLWQAILLGRERLAASEGAIAVPFDRSNGVLELRGGEVWLTLRLDRFEVPDRINGSSHAITMRLDMGRSKKRLVTLATEAASGRRSWAASKIRYDPKARRFFVSLSVELDSPVALIGGDLKATLEAPESGACWRLTVGDQVIDIGSGNSLAFLRRRLARESDCRRDNVGGARNGHGRRRLLRGVARLTGDWNNKTRTWNAQAVARIVKELQAGGVGTLVVTKPTAKSLLNTAGGVGPAWTVFEFCSNLERKGLEAGIAVRFSDAKDETSSDGEASCVAAVA